MKKDEPAFHYVCTHDRAQELVQNRNRFWVSNCGCREARGKCARSRMDICLIFGEGFPGSGSGKREVPLAEVEEILDLAREKHLVARPFRDEKKTGTDGICFCCDDCCGYFLNPQEKCDKGDLVENTDFEKCTDCGVCVSVCYFKARRMDGEKMAVETGSCHGCGLCVEVCPEECIRLMERK